jgi:hypothetical protein
LNAVIDVSFELKSTFAFEHHLFFSSDASAFRTTSGKLNWFLWRQSPLPPAKEAILLT